jgi:hypothetical protein
VADLEEKIYADDIGVPVAAFQLEDLDEDGGDGG